MIFIFRAMLLAATLLSLSATQSPSHRVTHGDHPNGDQRQSEPPAQPSPPPPVSTTAEVREYHPRDVDRDAAPKPYNWRGAFSPPTWANWALVVAAALASFIGISNLSAIRDQTKANKISAEAAKASADALINIERPWLLVSHTRNEKASHAGGKSYLKFRVKNYGKTPAMILEVGGSAQFFDDIKKELPESPEYGKAVFFNYRPLAFDMESGDIFVEYDATSGVGKKNLTGFGFVKYCGPFKGLDIEPYTTKFSYCFGYENQPCGLPGYNEHT